MCRPDRTELEFAVLLALVLAPLAYLLLKALVGTSCVQVLVAILGGRTS